MTRSKNMVKDFLVTLVEYVNDVCPCKQHCACLQTTKHMLTEAGLIGVNIPMHILFVCTATESLSWYTA